MSNISYIYTVASTKTPRREAVTKMSHIAVLTHRIHRRRLSPTPGAVPVDASVTGTDADAGHRIGIEPDAVAES